MSSDINYALVLGNVIHNVFQQILEHMNFRNDELEKIIKESMKSQLILLYFLKKTEEEVRADVKRAIKNITTWIGDIMFKQTNNPYKIKFEKFIAAEQEFNTNMYGIKGNIDSTIVVRTAEGHLRETALEIKTGK